MQLWCPVKPRSKKKLFPFSGNCVLLLWKEWGEMPRKRVEGDAPRGSWYSRGGGCDFPGACLIILTYSSGPIPAERAPAVLAHADHRVLC